MDCTQILDTSDLEDTPSYDPKIEVAKLILNDEEFTVYGGNNRIGRDPEFCSIVVNNTTLSKEHAVIEVADRYSHVIYDLDSKNKTKLGKMRLTPHVRYHLSHKALIQFGDVTTEYCILSEQDNERKVVEESDDEIIPETPLPRKFAPESSSNSTSPTIFEMSIQCECGNDETCGKLLGEPCGINFSNKQSENISNNPVVVELKHSNDNQSAQINKEVNEAVEKDLSGDETDPEDLFSCQTKEIDCCKEKDKCDGVENAMKNTCNIAPKGNESNTDSSETDMSGDEDVTGAEDIFNALTQVPPDIRNSRNVTNEKLGGVSKASEDCRSFNENESLNLAADDDIYLAATQIVPTTGLNQSINSSQIDEIPKTAENNINSLIPLKKSIVEHNQFSVKDSEEENILHCVDDSIYCAATQIVPPARQHKHLEDDTLSNSLSSEIAVDCSEEVTILYAATQLVPGNKKNVHEQNTTNHGEKKSNCNVGDENLNTYSTMSKDNSVNDICEAPSETRNDASEPSETKTSCINIIMHDSTEIEAICNAETQIISVSEAGTKSYGGDGAKITDGSVKGKSNKYKTPDNSSVEKEGIITTDDLNVCESKSIIPPTLPNPSMDKKNESAVVDKCSDDFIFIAPTQLAPTVLEKSCDENKINFQKDKDIHSSVNELNPVSNENATCDSKDEIKILEETNKSMDESFFIASTQLISCERQSEDGLDQEDGIKSPLSTSSTYSSIHDAPTQCMDEVDGACPAPVTNTSNSIELCGAGSSVQVHEKDVNPKERNGKTETNSSLEQNSPNCSKETLGFCHGRESLDLVLPSSQELREASRAIYGEISDSDLDEKSSPIIQTRNLRIRNTNIKSKECKRKLNLKLMQNYSDSEALNSMCEKNSTDELASSNNRKVKRSGKISSLKQTVNKKEDDNKKTFKNITEPKNTSNTENKIIHRQAQVANLSNNENEFTSSNSESGRPSRLRKMTWKARDSYECPTVLHVENKLSDAQCEESYHKKKKKENYSLSKVDDHVINKSKVFKVPVESAVSGNTRKLKSLNYISCETDLTTQCSNPKLPSNSNEKDNMMEKEGNHKRKKDSVSSVEKEGNKSLVFDKISLKEKGAKERTHNRSKERTSGKNMSIKSEMFSELQKKENVSTEEKSLKTISKRISKESENVSNKSPESVESSDIKTVAEKNGSKISKIRAFSDANVCKKINVKGEMSKKEMLIEDRSNRRSTRNNMTLVEKKSILTSALIPKETRNQTRAKTGESKLKKCEECVVLGNSKVTVVQNYSGIVNKSQNTDEKKIRKSTRGCNSANKHEDVFTKDSDVSEKDDNVSKRKRKTRTVKDSVNVVNEMVNSNIETSNEFKSIPKEYDTVNDSTNFRKSTEKRKTRSSRISRSDENIKRTNIPADDKTKSCSNNTTEGKDQHSSKKCEEPEFLLKNSAMKSNESNLVTTSNTKSHLSAESNPVMGSHVIKTRTRKIPKRTSLNVTGPSNNDLSIHSAETVTRPVKKSPCDRPAPQKRTKHIEISSPYNEDIERTISMKLKGTRSSIRNISEERSVMESPTARKRSIQSNSSESLSCSGEVTPKRSCRLSQKIPFKIMFTGVVASTTDKTAIKRLGGTLVDEMDKCSVLITDKVRRTYKFLCFLGQGKPIVSAHWLKQSHLSGYFLDPWDFIVEDKEAEKNFKFTLKESLQQATTHKLLKGYAVFATPSVKPPPSEMKGIVESCGGNFLSREPSCIAWPEKSFVIASTEDKKLVAKLKKNFINIVSSELILTGILQQKLNFSECGLKC